MRFILSVILTAFFAAIGTYFFPWWFIAPCSFLVTLAVRQKQGASFLSGFTGIGLLWLIWSLIESSANNHILLARMAVLFNLPAPWMYIAITVLTGALVGGLSAWAGQVHYS